MIHYVMNVYLWFSIFHMNLHLQKLYQIALKPHRHIIGLMSGTSLDGLDVAYCKISASALETKLSLIHFHTFPYDPIIKERIRKVFAKTTIDFPYLAMLHESLGQFYAQLILEFLRNHELTVDDVDCIASHGQTVMHQPKHIHHEVGYPNATLQIGDGDQIAVHTGIITISDFRQKHIAAGGEGAPLAIYGDYLLFGQGGEDRIMLNLGGISNFTYLPKNKNTTEIFVTDTGPCNTLMDAWMQKYHQMPYDDQASMAKNGQVNHRLLEACMSHPFFVLPFPKTTGPEMFNLTWLENCISQLGLEIKSEDVMATLNKWSAESIIAAIKTNVGVTNKHVYMSGGGAHNPLLLQHLKQGLAACHFELSDTLGILGDAKEAVLFAVLANETIAGKPIDFGANSNIPSICMGKISFPR